MIESILVIIFGLFSSVVDAETSKDKEIPKLRPIVIEFRETIETCPLQSYGSKKFCSINKKHKCHQICLENPICCDTTKRLEK